jgi:hypothetical protein
VGEILFQKENSGIYAIAFMNGSVITNSAWFLGEESDISPWRLRAIGDLDGDGRHEVIGEKDENSVFAVGFMSTNGFDLAASAFLLGAETVVSPWYLVAASDTAGDGTADLIFKHGDDSLYDRAEMYSYSVTNSTSLFNNTNIAPQVIEGPR